MVEFSKDEKTVLVEKLKRYFESELNQDIGGFDAEFLLDFFSEEMGVYYYNQGLQDARDVLSTRLDEISDTIYDLEKATTFKR